MTNEIEKVSGTISPFERIRRTNEAGNEYWSSRDFAQVLGYTDYRNFEQVVLKARTACFNSGHRIVGSRTISLTSPKWLRSVAELAKRKKNQKRGQIWTLDKDRSRPQVLTRDQFSLLS